ncbi:LPS assembly lipoprotein LptE [Planctomycetota bacterium]|nr:LPS assembly lipoprotein LptE [Planctomycetota bacterium]
MGGLSKTPILILVLASVLAGCGYTMSASLDTTETRTVKFTTAENRLFPYREGFEYDFSRRLKDEIATDARLEQASGYADVILKVSLIRFEEPNLIEDTDSGDPAEVGLRITADVQATGNAFIDGSVKRKVTVFQSYAPSLGESREAALTRLWRDLAREVLDIAADTEWSTP